MKANTYYLFDNEKQVARSGSLENLLNKSIPTTNGKIYYNGVLMWVKHPTKEDIK